MVSEESLARLLAYVADAKEKGATVVSGGARAERPGFFMQPTILVLPLPPFIFIFNAHSLLGRHPLPCSLALHGRHRMRSAAEPPRPRGQADVKDGMACCCEEIFGEFWNQPT